MLKTLALIVRRPDHSRDAFRAHYEEIHAPLAMETVLEGTLRYVRHHLREEIHGEPDFDVVTAFWYRDLAAAQGLVERVAGPVGERIRTDEATFMDRPRNTFFAVSERTLQGAESRDAGLLALALVRAPAGEDAEDFVPRYEKHHVPAMLDAVEDPRWCHQNVAFAVGPEAPAFDAVTQIHARRDLALAQWAAALEASGCRVRVARVSEHETQTPWD